MVVVALPDLFRGMGVWKNSAENQQSGHAPKPEPEIKDGSSAKDGTPESPRCKTSQKVSHMLQLMTAGATKRNLLPPYPDKRTKGGDRVNKSGTAHSGPGRQELESPQSNRGNLGKERMCDSSPGRPAGASQPCR